MPEPTRPPAPPRFWRSPAEQAGDPRVRELQAAEFAPLAAESPALETDAISRRRFLSLLGATAAMAAATTGCSRQIDRGTIVPYTKRPEEGVPGVASWYATSTAEGCYSFPLLVKTREARPILIEGNDEHPDALGAAPMRLQADLLGLYDPERLRTPEQSGKTTTWPMAEKALQGALRGPALLLTPAIQSPARQALLDRLRAALPGLRVAAWEAAAPHGALAAAQALFGAQLLPRLHLDKARVILCLEADIFAGDGDVPRQIRGFADGRRLTSSQETASRSISRLWVAESRMTLTGGKSDQRLPVRGVALGALGRALARRLSELGLAASIVPDAPTLAELAAGEGLDSALLERLAQDLHAAGGAAVVVAGSNTGAEVHAAAILLNRMLGAEGRTVEYRPAALSPLATPDEMAGLGRQLAQGAFKALILWDVNPAYDGPAGVDWAAAIAKCPQRLRLGRQRDESAAVCEWLLPTHHWLESWGDQQGGLLQQPVVAPLFDTRQADELLLDALRGLGQNVPATMEEWLRERWRPFHARLDSPLSFAAFWHAALHDGFVRESGGAVVPTFDGAALSGLLSSSPVEGLELTLHADRRLHDGRGAHIGWLQELPDPVTKCTWGNPLALAPADARRLGIQDGDQVALKADGGELHVNALVQPGQKEGCVSLALGYGRRGLAVAEGIGVNAFPLLAAGRWVVPGVQVTRIGKGTPVHSTQEHHLMEGRDIVRSLPLAAYAAGETGAPHHAEAKAAGETLPTGRNHGRVPRESHPPSLYPGHHYPGHKWGMVIDLGACVGCAGCVVACQAENNIPVVGPERIDEGREMQWLRIDRYYEGGEDNPDMVFMPMLCQHCDNAPCENVCPVAATTHSEEGLNQMTYNRCVGTRYCANNCPYKVRHFNYFDYTGHTEALLQMAANPEVSIRPRGVMEKCSFCVQRINDARNRAKAEERALADGEIKPACAVACPAAAITFGDLNADSAAARLAAGDRGYKVLAELGVRPAVTYLAEVRNPIATGGPHAS